MTPADAEALAQVAARTPRTYPISALTGQGLADLLAAVAAELAEPTSDETLHLGFDQGRERAWLFDRKLVRAEQPTCDGYDMRCAGPTATGAGTRRCADARNTL